MKMFINKKGIMKKEWLPLTDLYYTLKIGKKHYVILNKKFTKNIGIIS